MKNNFVKMLAAICLLSACKKGGQEFSGSLNSQQDSAAYAVGVLIGSQMKNDGFDSLNTKIMEAALAATLKGDTNTLIKVEKCQQVLMTYAQSIEKRKGEAAVEEGKKFLEENKKKSGVMTTASGLQYLVEKEGTGAMPVMGDSLVVHYHGTHLDGKVFDSSVDRGQPAEFTLDRVIPGWTEALQLMKVGSKWKVFVPSNLAYGERGMGGRIGPNETLVFEMELVAIKGK